MKTQNKYFTYTLLIENKGETLADMRAVFDQVEEELELKKLKVKLLVSEIIPRIRKELSHELEAIQFIKDLIK